MAADKESWSEEPRSQDADVEVPRFLWVEAGPYAEVEKRNLEPVKMQTSKPAARMRPEDPVYVVLATLDRQNPVCGLLHSDKRLVLEGARRACEQAMGYEPDRREAYTTWVALEILDKVIQAHALHWGNPPLGEATPKAARRRARRREVLLHNRIDLQDVLPAYADLYYPDELQRLKRRCEKAAFREPVYVSSRGLRVWVMDTLRLRSEAEPPIPGGLQPAHLTGRVVLGVLRYYGLVERPRGGAERGWRLHHDRLMAVLRDFEDLDLQVHLPWMQGRYYLRK